MQVSSKLNSKPYDYLYTNYLQKFISIEHTASAVFIVYLAGFAVKEYLNICVTKFSRYLLSARSVWNVVLAKYESCYVSCV